jgi:hypothetical protein
VTRKIPAAVIAVMSDILAMKYTHARIDYFMEAAGIECDGPFGNKVDQARAYLRAANEKSADPLAALGKAITEFMEVDSSGYASDFSLEPERDKVKKILGEYGI